MKLLLEIKGIFDEGRGYQKIKHEIEVELIFKVKKTKIDDMKLTDESLKDDLKKAMDSDHFKTSRKEQYDDYLSSGHDSIIRDMMYDLGIYTIENWKILRVGEKRMKAKKSETGVLVVTKAEKKAHKVKELIDELVYRGNITQATADEFEAVYVHMANTIGDLSIIKQTLIVFDAVGIGAMTATKALQDLMDYSDSLKGLSLKELNELKDRTNRKLL